jgi:hypothetical protein
MKKRIVLIAVFRFVVPVTAMIMKIGRTPVYAGVRQDYIGPWLE